MPTMAAPTDPEQPVEAAAAPDGAVDADRPPVERVRVVLADIALARAGYARTELAEQSPVGEALVRGLMRTQLGLALRLAAVVAIGLGGLPLLFAVAPAVADTRPFGVALPWLLLGLVAYPFLFGAGAVYVWMSERTESEFTELVERR
jgi:hypothetical protein